VCACRDNRTIKLVLQPAVGSNFKGSFSTVNQVIWVIRGFRHGQQQIQNHYIFKTGKHTTNNERWEIEDVITTKSKCFVREMSIT
jgi:hypothetical protein